MSEKPRPTESGEEGAAEVPPLTIPEFIKINEPPMSELAEAARNGDKNAKLVFAQLQTIDLLQSMEPTPENNRKFLSTLKEVSRDIVTALANSNKTPEQVQDSLSRLSEVFNAHTRDRFSVQTPSIGANVDMSYMIPTKGNKRVGKVKTWAVRDDNGSATYKAEVE